MKEKRKNFTNEDLKAISQRATSDAKESRQEWLQSIVDRIEAKLTSGDFKTNKEGFLVVRFLQPLENYTDASDMRELLRRNYSAVEVDGGMIWSTFKVKP